MTHWRQQFSEYMPLAIGGDFHDANAESSFTKLVCRFFLVLVALLLQSTDWVCCLGWHG
jgi:hypothetical protein